MYVYTHFDFKIVLFKVWQYVDMCEISGYIMALRC